MSKLRLAIYISLTAICSVAFGWLRDFHPVITWLGGAIGGVVGTMTYSRYYFQSLTKKRQEEIKK